MAYSIAWNESSPAGSSTNANTLDTELQDQKKAVRERMNDILHSSTAWETDAHDPKLLDRAAIAGTPSVAQVTHNSDQSLTTGVALTLAFDTEILDTASYHDPSTNNSRLVTSAAGYYRISCSIRVTAGASGAFILTALAKNGVNYHIVSDELAATDILNIKFSVIVLAAASDFWEVTMIQVSSTTWTVGQDIERTIFSIEKLDGTT